MIKEHNRHEFYKIYNSQHLTLKNRRCCFNYTRIEYYPNYGVRLSCRCGEGCLTLKREDFPEIDKEEEFVAMAVERWNNGHNDVWWQ